MRTKRRTANSSDERGAVELAAWALVTDMVRDAKARLATLPARLAGLSDEDPMTPFRRRHWLARQSLAESFLTWAREAAHKGDPWLALEWAFGEGVRTTLGDGSFFPTYGWVYGPRPSNKRRHLGGRDKAIADLVVTMSGWHERWTKQPVDETEVRLPDDGPVRRIGTRSIVARSVPVPMTALEWMSVIYCVMEIAPTDTPPGCAEDWEGCWGGHPRPANVASPKQDFVAWAIQGLDWRRDGAQIGKHGWGVWLAARALGMGVSRVAQVAAKSPPR